MTESLTCKELVEIVTDYLEGVLPSDDRTRFESHINVCQDCLNYLDQMRRTIALVGRLSEDDIPEASKTQLLELFRGWKSNNP